SEIIRLWPGAHLELRFHDVIEPQPGLVPPEFADIHRLLEFGRHIIDEGDCHLLTCCPAGISRSTAAMTLLLAQAEPDRPAESIFADIVRIRPIVLPNLRMIHLGVHIMDRGGRLIAVVNDHYTEMARHFPEVFISRRATKSHWSKGGTAVRIR